MWSVQGCPPLWCRRNRLGPTGTHQGRSLFREGSSEMAPVGTDTARGTGRLPNTRSRQNQTPRPALHWKVARSLWDLSASPVIIGYT